MPIMPITRIISGGQTGVDRAGLDAAIELGIEHGGYAPKGRIAEDGLIPEKYNLEELTKGGYPARTKKNIESSDGSLIFCKGTPKTGTKLTVEYARKIGKPFLVLDSDAVNQPTAVRLIQEWIEDEKIEILNVAGPRLSSAPMVSILAKKILIAALGGI